MFRRAFSFYKSPAIQTGAGIAAYAIGAGTIFYLGAKADREEYDDFKRKHPGIEPDIHYKPMGMLGVKTEYVMPKKPGKC